MSRLLFIGPPFVGHLNPVISVAMELEARGHEIGAAEQAGLEVNGRTRLHTGLGCRAGE
jgi:hypothetical protein